MQSGDNTRSQFLRGEAAVSAFLDGGHGLLSGALPKHLPKSSMLSGTIPYDNGDHILGIGSISTVPLTRERFDILNLK